MKNQRAIIIGAGPAGLTAAYELLTRTDIQPIVLEKSDCVGGISRTVNYKGNRIDIGGHRFFSKSDRVMSWWLRMLPLPDAASEDRVMLLRSRKSRIYYLRRFFDYPITLSLATLRKLGLLRTLRIGISYVKSALFPLKEERTLEQFFINRFGKELYNTFFKSYTEKVWGVPCGRIGAEWGAQRIKGLSVWAALAHALKKAFHRGGGGIGQ
jgi:protoporphyrinogen oxidase